MQAWLSLTPTGSSATNAQLYGHHLPQVPADYVYLLNFFYEIGVAGQGTNGPVCLPFSEIHAWSALTGIALEPFELRIIRALSNSFVAVAQDRDAWCPIEDQQVTASIDEANIASWKAFSSHD